MPLVSLEGLFLCAKLFMKDPWEKTEYAPKRLRAFVDLVRPFTLLAPAVGGFSGACMAMLIQRNMGSPTMSTAFPFLDWPELELYKIISGIASLVLLNSASNALNQVMDRDTDRVNKPYRPIPSGLISPKEGIWIAVLLYGLALWRATLVNRMFVLFVSVLILNTIAYSVSPLRLKKRLWLSNISIALPRGLLGIVAAYSIVGDPFQPEPWLLGSVMAVFLVGSTTTKDITDMEGDREFGMRTLPVVYGKRNAILVSVPFFVIPFVMMVAYWYLDFLPGPTLYVAVLFLMWSLLVAFLLIKEGDREDEHFENSPAWKQMYLMLMGMQIGFLSLFIL